MDNITKFYLLVKENNRTLVGTKMLLTFRTASSKFSSISSKSSSLFKMPGEHDKGLF